MAIDADEVRVAPFGHISRAPVGSVLPTNATMALDAAFVDLGYADEDGVSITPGIDTSEIMAWQSALPVEITLDSVSFEVAFNLMQVNKTTWGMYFFSNMNWVNNFGQARLTLASNPGAQIHAIIVDWNDEEADNYRLVLPKANLTDREALQLSRTGAQITGVTFKALDVSGTFGYLYSDNPDLVPVS